VKLRLPLAKSDNEKLFFWEDYMSLISNVIEVLHRIRVKLYPNYLPGVEGTYIARTDNEALLSIEQVCTSLINRADFTCDYEDLVEYIRQFFDEAVYLLCDGYAVNMRYFSLHPNVGGIFNSVNEAHDRKKHPVTFRFRTRSALRKLVKHTAIDIEGLADCSSWIDEFIDTEEDSTNTLYVPGDQFILLGNKIRVEGDDPACGVYFVPVVDPSKAVKVTHIAENNPSKIIGIAPKTQYKYNKIEIRTQFESPYIKFFKKIRIITSSFVVEEN
jgi:hypothetical protein